MKKIEIIIIVFVVLTLTSNVNGSSNLTRCIDTQQLFTLINGFVDKLQGIITLSHFHPQTKVFYNLYTRLNPKIYQEIIIGNKTSLNLSNFNASWPTRFIISGWMNIHSSCAANKIKNAYLYKGNFNVIMVNWDETSRNIDYVYLSLTVEEVAKNFSNFTIFLNETKNVSFSNMYVIGYSLGAQIAGLAGKLIAPNQFNTIFALEPAGPMFYRLGFDKRVDANDAEYVEAIQTNIGIAGYYGEGGRASFYPNYGHYQPHCPLYNPACSHAASVEYFAESLYIKDDDDVNGFYGKKCESFNKLATFNKCNCKYHSNCTNCIIGKMGGDPSTPKTGVYFLRTKKRPPYYKPIKKSIKNLY